MTQTLLLKTLDKHLIFGHIFSSSHMHTQTKQFSTCVQGRLIEGLCVAGLQLAVEESVVCGRFGFFVVLGWMNDWKREGKLELVEIQQQSYVKLLRYMLALY